jgi:peptidoglycan-associated lipoprotein
MRTRTNTRALFSALLLVVTLSAACKKPIAVAPPPPPPPPAPAPAQPTVNLQASAANIQRGEAVTLNWTSTNATSLNLSPGVGTVAAQGNTRVTPTDSTTYTLTAMGPGGTADSSVRVGVTVPPPPPPPPVAHVDTLQEMFDKNVRDAYYDYDKADIRADARDALNQTGTFLRAHPEAKVIIEGHCDERGSTEYNLALGDRRAAAAKQFLVSSGLSADRLQTVSYGKERPFCSASTEECWQQNRRAHFVLAQ